MTPFEPTVGVCVATFRRAQGLEAVLAAIARQSFTEDVRPHLIVFVVDNDPAASAAATVEHARAQHDLEIRYSVEARRGVVPARNASVAAALENGVDFVAFVDDDETPHPDWLSCLLATQRATGATVVGGPVIEVVGTELPAWYRNAGFYPPPDRLNGAPAPYAACGNSLYAASSLATIDGPFDPRFNTSGGEDVFLSLTLLRRGATIVWSPDARVDTPVPIERARLRHVARRHYIGAANFTRAERTLDGRKVTRVATGLGRVVVGSVRTIGGLLRFAPHRMAHGVVAAAEGAGVIVGAVGGGGRRPWWVGDG